MNITELTLKGHNATIPDFIAYFETIPEEHWCVDQLCDGRGRCCARGHVGTMPGCGKTVLDARLLHLAPNVVEHNNHEYSDLEWEGSTKRSQDASLNYGAKARVLAYLRSLL